MYIFYTVTLFIFSEIETFKEWMRYRYGVFPESGFDNDKLYPRKYEFGGDSRQNVGCKGISTVSSKSLDGQKLNSESRDTKSFVSDYNYDSSRTVSHVTVPFLPNDESNEDDRQHLKLEEFKSTTFKVGSGVFYTTK